MPVVLSIEAQIDFDYLIYYRAEPERIVVLAIIHASRNPSIWEERA